MIPRARFIAWASQLVPFMRRHEWAAEVAYAWTTMNQDGPPSWGAVMRYPAFTSIAKCRS